MSRKKHRKPRHMPPAPNGGSAALAESEARLRDTEQNVIGPLELMRRKNHVTALVTMLINEKGGRHERPCPG